MAKSTCVKCGNTSFENVEQTPTNSNFVYVFIQCASCGGVVGVTDFVNIGAELQDLRKILDKILNRM